MALSKKTETAVAKYGRETCVKAARLHAEGNGASTIGVYLDLKTNQADAAINAGEELAKAAGWAVYPYQRGFVVLRGERGEALTNDGSNEPAFDAGRRDCFFLTRAAATAAIDKYNSAK